MIVIMAQQVGTDLRDITLQVFGIGIRSIALGAELLVAGIGGKDIDVGDMFRIPLTQVGHKSG